MSNYISIYDRFNDIEIPLNEVIFECIEVGDIIRYKCKIEVGDIIRYKCKIEVGDIIRYKCKIEVGDIIRYKCKKYVVIQTIKYTTGKQSIDVIPEEEYIKQSTMVNLHFDYVTLKEVENTLKNVYGFSLYKEEDKKNVKPY